MKSDLAELTELTYAAATDPARWPAMLDRLGEALGARSVALLALDVDNVDGTIVANRGFPSDLDRAYNEYYGARNVWLIRGKHLQVPGRVRVSEECCPEDELVKTEFYNDFLRPLGARHALGGTILKDGAIAANVTALREKASGPFDPAGVRLLSAVMPHMRGAIETYRRLAGSRLEEQALLDTLDRLPLGLMLFDQQPAPVFVNSEARRILAANDGLSLGRGGMLTATRPQETAALRALIAAAATPNGGGGHVALGRPSLLRPLGVDVVPLVLPANADLPSRAVAVFILDPERQPETDAAVVARLYGLTRAEAELAVRLVGGETLEQAAERQGVTRETARTHVKRILRKTGTSSQAELLRRLIQGPAQMACAAATSAQL